MPASLEEVASIVREAAEGHVPVTIRGGGHSQGGQSLSAGGLVIDMARLNRIELVGRDLIRAQGGTQWGEVVDALRGTGRLPRVLVDTGEATVGGTLAAGGLGTTSHRYGVQAEQVERLEVVTGTGARVRCSRAENAGLFDAVRGGQGQFGIIVDAWIRLRTGGRRIRLYELSYRDGARFLADFEKLVAEARFDHLRAQTRIHEHQVILNVGAEYDGEHDDKRALEGLGHDEIVGIRDTAEVGRAGIYPKWGFLPRNHHPWRDWFLPWATVGKLVTQPWLDPGWVPRAPFSWIGMYPIGMGEDDAPLFMRPVGGLMISYSILAVLSRRERASELAERLKKIDRALIGLGGKAYLSGRVGYGPREWREHYGDRFAAAARWKQEFDPRRIFRWDGMPFGDTAAEAE